MAATDKLFAGKIPEIYDRFLVPLIFESYAGDLAERVAKIKPRYVLETAAGTGALTRAIASRLPIDARIVATDLNQPMLDHGAAKQPHDSRIIWQQADALALPYEEAGRAFPVSTHAIGLPKTSLPALLARRLPHSFHTTRPISCVLAETRSDRQCLIERSGFGSD
jgi:hypothetical protein